MRAFHPLSVTAVSALALAAGPALAQQATALPPLASVAAAGADYAGQPADITPGAERADEAPGWDGPPPPPAAREDGPPSHWHDGHRPMPRGPQSRPDFPPRRGEPVRVGYSPEERDGWLEECSHRLDGDRDDRDHDGRARHECEAYLHSYEGSYRGGYYGQNAYSGPGGAYPVAAAPMMLVPVLLPAQNCGCPPKRTVRTIVTYETVPEKVVTYERVPTKVVRTKYVKTVAVKPTKSRPIKSTK